MRSRGRKTDEHRLSKRITVPMTADMLRVVQEAAEQRKMPAADMIRRILEAHLCGSKEAAA